MVRKQESAYYQQIMKSFPEDSRLLKQPYGMELLNNYFTYKQTFIFRDREYTMEERLAELNVPELKAEYILAKIPTTDYRRYCEYERYYMPLLPESYRQRMRHLQERPVSILQPGELAPNLMYPDTNGQLHSMADFKGKYKYIDIWATWCSLKKFAFYKVWKELEGRILLIKHFFIKPKAGKILFGKTIKWNPVVAGD
ncbi:MAG: TlpA family protein disulfide reductase [Butyricimonas faecihominis]